MRNQIKNFILSLRKKWLLMAYIILILLVMPAGLFWMSRIVFLFYALFIFIILKITVEKKDLLRNFNFKVSNRFCLLLILFSCLIILFTRLLPFLRFGEAPLGYDTGFYHERSTMPGVLTETEPFYFILAAMQIFGLKTIWAINLFYLISQFLLPASLYLLFQSLKIKHRFIYAAMAFFIYAISTTQFQAFWSMFPQQILSIAFLLTTVALILRQSPLAILSGYLGAALNTPSFAVFLLTIVIFILIIYGLQFFKRLFSDNRFLLFCLLGYALIYFVLAIILDYYSLPLNESYSQYIFQLSKYIGWLILLPIIILFYQLVSTKKIISFKILLFIIFIFAMWNFFYLTHQNKYVDEVGTSISFITEYRGLASNYPAWRIPEIKGFFVNSSTFSLMNILLIPFAIFSFLFPGLLSEKPTDNKALLHWLIFLYTIVLLLLLFVTFPFIYQHRFLILFDIFLIIFVTPALTYFLNNFMGNRFGRVLAGLFFLLLAVKIIIAAWHQQPLLPPAEYKEIASLAKLVEPKARLLATHSNNTPWVMGFSKLIAFGPGYGGDTWSLNDWIAFWRSDDDQQRLKLMQDSGYDNYPFYFYIGDREPADWPYQKFIRTNSHFKQITDHVWKYIPSL